MTRSINLLILSGSPVSGSSTDILLENMLSGVKEGLGDAYSLQVNKVELAEIPTTPCIACGQSPEPKFCIYPDLDEVYEALINADCVLFGSPVYFDSVSAQAKVFIDRCNCFRPAEFDNPNAEHPFKKRLAKKRPAAMALVGGEHGWFEGARRVIAGFFKWVELTNEGMVTYATKDFTQRGEVTNDNDTLHQAQQLGKTIAKKLRE